MPELFAAVKQQIPLIKYAETAGSQIIRTGSTCRANPCPVCGHHDCCTIYPEDNSFSCFSCEAAGDVINMERAIHHHESNFEAARTLADRYHIHYDKTQKSEPDPQKTPQTSPDTGRQPKTPAKQQKTATRSNTLPEIDPERAAALRAVMAEHFHQALLADEAALKYQTERRGHAKEIISTHKIGIATANPIAAAKEAGYTMEDLHAVCLLRRRGKGYGPYIPAGVYVYPHFRAGKIVHFTLKDPSKTYQFQLKRAGADPDWLCYGQDAMENASALWLVEGEDDRLTMIEYGGLKDVSATIGNTNTPYLLDWIGKNAAGKTFYLCFDPDDAGKKYLAKYGTAIVNSGGTAYFVDLAKYGEDIDSVLRKADDPAAVVKQLKQNATPIELKNNDEGEPDYSFGSFEVLGETSDGSLAFWSSVFRRTYFIPIKELTLDQLCQIGGNEVRARVSRTVQEGMIQFKSLKTHLIVQAAHNYLGNLKVLGQGIHQLRDNRLLIVNGDEAVIWDGTTFTRQDYPIIDRQFIAWESDLRWINLDRVMEETRAMNTDRAYDIFDELLNLIARWKFSSPDDHILLAGWVCAQIVQTAWDWRPQLWLSGASGSGKTMLSLLIEALGGNLVCRFEGNILTEPGLRQTLQNHAYMTIIDEFEESPHRERIIERLRSAGRGGKGAIGSSRQEAVFSHIRHMILIASIETGLIRAAEQYRYLQVATQKDNQVKPTIPSPAECDRLQVQMVAYALWAIFRAKELIRNMESVPGYDNRWVHSVAVPFSMLAAFDETPGQTLYELVFRYLSHWADTQEGGIMEDEAALLQDIMLSTVRVAEEQTEQFGPSKTVYTERTVAQILAELPLREEDHKTLQAHGVRLTDDYSLFLYPETAAKMLLGRTRWKDLNLRDILLRCQNAARARRRLAGAIVRGVLIPYDTWQQEE
ncbi:MAG: toprim domain-containing protein [Desulfosalsimonas sp.]